MHSQHIHAELTGWRTAKGLLLREPIQATFTYTPALAKCGPVLSSFVPANLARTCQCVHCPMISQSVMSMQQALLWVTCAGGASDCRQCQVLRGLMMGA